MPRPPRPEQDRIAAILSAWAKGEEVCTGLIDAKTRLRAAIVTRLLERDGQPTRLGDVVEESRLRNNGLALGQDTVRAVNKVEGMIPMKENVISSDLGRYKVVRKDWFAYNPMRLNIGSIARWHEDRDVLVSPDYVVLRCRDGLLDADYLDHLRRSPRWARFVEEAGNGSVRVRIYYADLARLRVPLPPIAASPPC